MTTNPTHHAKCHTRRSIRLKGYDYSLPGSYFITICTYHKQHLFGEIIAGKMKVNDLGNIIQNVWTQIPSHFPNTRLDTSQIMPNHFHGIIAITNYVGVPYAEPSWARHAVPLPQHEQYGKPTSGSIPTIIRSFKSESTRQIHLYQQNCDSRVWQRNYWEYIIRDETDYHSITLYIENNPSQWETDELNMNNQKRSFPYENDR